MALLQVTLATSGDNRALAAEVYAKYRRPFLDRAPGAKSKQLLVREEDVQVLHEFDSVANAQAYLTNPLFADDIVGELGPLLDAAPDVRIYEQA